LMNGTSGLWTILLVALVGLGGWLVTLGWPFLQTLSPETPAGQLLEITDRLAGAQDFDAQVVLESDQGEPVELRVRYVRHPALRIDLVSPSELAGEVYTLRRGGDGWIVVHYRPYADRAVGISHTMDAPEWLDEVLDARGLRIGLQLGRITVSSPEPGVIEVQQVPGPFSRVTIHRPPEEDVLLSQLDLYSLDDGQLRRALRIHVHSLELNQGTEFRDLLSLPQWPYRWFEQ